MPIQTLPSVQIFGYAYDPTTGLPMVNAQITISWNIPLGASLNPLVDLVPRSYQTTTDQFGYWTALVTPTDQMTPANSTYHYSDQFNSYDFDCPLAGVPGGGWQILSRRTSAPAVLNPAAQTVGTLLVTGPLTVNGLATFNNEVVIHADTEITADDGIGLRVIGAATGFEALSVEPHPTLAGGVQGLHLAAAVFPAGGITSVYHGLQIDAGTLIYHAASFIGTSQFYQHQIMGATLDADAPYTTAGRIGTLYVKGPTLAGNFSYGPAPTAAPGHYAIVADGGLTAIAVPNSTDFYNNSLVAGQGFILLNAVGSRTGNPMGLHLDYSEDAYINPPFTGATLSGMNLSPLNQWGIKDNFTDLRMLNIIPPSVNSNTAGNWTITDASTVYIAQAPTVNNTGIGVAAITNAYGLWVNARTKLVGSTIIQTTSTNALFLTADGTHSTLRVNNNPANAVVGLVLTPGAAGAGYGLKLENGNAAESLTIDAKGAGTITLGSISTGGIILARALFSSLVGAPTFTNINAGISGTPTVVGNDTRGTITYVTTGTPPAANSRLFTVSYANAGLYTSAPVVWVVNASGGAADATHSQVAKFVNAVGTTSFDVIMAGTIESASATLKLNYAILG